MIDMALLYTWDLSSGLVATNEKKEKLVPALIPDTIQIAVYWS